MLYYIFSQIKELYIKTYFISVVISIFLATKRLKIGNSTLDVGSEKKKNRKAWSISANTDIFNIKEDNIGNIFYEFI